MAIQCNASDIHLNTATGNFVSANSSFSITTWINANWNPGGPRSMVGIYGPLNQSNSPTAAPVTAVQIGSYVGNGDLRCWTWGGSSLVNTAASFMTPFNNTWVFIAYTYDGTTHRVYVNGSLAASSAAAQTAGYLKQIYINGYPGGGTGEVYNHLVDQYSLYNRTLTADEIVTMFSANGGRHGIIQGLIAKYEFDEKSQGQSCTSVPDLSGLNNQLTSLGAGTPINYDYTSPRATSNFRPVQ